MNETFVLTIFLPTRGWSPFRRQSYGFPQFSGLSRIFLNFSRITWFQCVLVHQIAKSINLMGHMKFSGFSGIFWTLQGPSIQECSWGHPGPNSGPYEAQAVPAPEILPRRTYICHFVCFYSSLTKTMQAWSNGSSTTPTRTRGFTQSTSWSSVCPLC